MKLFIKATKSQLFYSVTVSSEITKIKEAVEAELLKTGLDDWGLYVKMEKVIEVDTSMTASPPIYLSIVEIVISDEEFIEDYDEIARIINHDFMRKGWSCISHIK